MSIIVEILGHQRSRTIAHREGGRRFEAARSCRKPAAAAITNGKPTVCLFIIARVKSIHEVMFDSHACASNVSTHASKSRSKWRHVRVARTRCRQRDHAAPRRLPIGRGDREVSSFGAEPGARLA